MQKKKKLSTIIICVLLIILLLGLISWRLIIFVFFSNNVKSNVPEAFSEIGSIIDENSYPQIELESVFCFNKIYYITFFCKNVNINNSDECNEILKESVSAFEKITSHIDTSSKLFNSKLSVEFRINGSLPYNIKLCNFEYDFDSAQSKTGKTVFNKLVSVNIDFQLDDLSDIYDHITDLYTINIGSNCLVKESEFKSKYK